MRRPLLALLLVAYAAVFVRFPAWSSASAPFDPLEPRGREVERAIDAGQFAAALPIARELLAAHADDATVLFWLAEIHRGLGRPADEAVALERVLRLTRQADAACPALPEAYARSGDTVRSFDAYERCASAGATDAERWFDLATAYAAAGRVSDAETAFATSRTLDPTNPRLPPPSDTETGR